VSLSDAFGASEEKKMKSNPDFIFARSKANELDEAKHLHKRIAMLVDVDDEGHVMSMTTSEMGDGTKVVDWRNYGTQDSVPVTSGLQNCWNRGTVSGLKECRPDMAAECPDFSISVVLYRNCSCPEVAEDGSTPEPAGPHAGEGKEVKVVHKSWGVPFEIGRVAKMKELFGN